MIFSSFTVISSYLFLHNKLPYNFSGLKQQIYYYLSFCRSELSHSWAESSTSVSLKAVIKVLASAGVSTEGLTVEIPASKLTWFWVGFNTWRGLLDWGSHVRAGCWLSSVPCYIGLSRWAACFIKMKAAKTKSSSKTEVIVFCNLIMEVVSPQC